MGKILRKSKTEQTSRKLAEMRNKIQIKKLRNSAIEVNWNS